MHTINFIKKNIFFWIFYLARSKVFFYIQNHNLVNSPLILKCLTTFL